MKRVIVERGRYFDSVFLMRVSQQLEAMEGIRQAVVVMGTPANREALERVGFSLDGEAIGERPAPNDLVIGLELAADADPETALDALQRMLAGTQEEGPGQQPKPAHLDEALALDPGANLALISVPGTYAAYEARRALRRGLHVMLFSDNVSVDEEIALKEEAVARGLLMMGPDCGTAILNGVPLGFANVCRRGAIGVVGASGTGIQEICSLVHQGGGGISQAIGTGGRDLSTAVGARMTRFGIDALAADPKTEVIIVVSKAPDRGVVPQVLDRLRASGKPGVVQFVGFDPDTADPAWVEPPVRLAGTLEEAAGLACEASGRSPERRSPPMRSEPARGAVRGRLLGLFCGGTLCQEAWHLLDRAGIEVASNVAFRASRRVPPEAEVMGHALWDLGDDAFTVGRPHPMIEPALRDGRVARAGTDPHVGLVLADCVLGYGVHPDPGGSLAAAAREALAAAAAGGRRLEIIASVTGTDLDPQNASQQRGMLEAAGVLVADSNAAAAGWALERLAEVAP
jgi:succinyl-CoA synthetase alpha subunit